MSPVTKTTYIDNFESAIPNTIEVGIGKKKAFIEHGSCKVINRDNIKNLENYQAFKLAKKIARNFRRR